MIFIIKHLIALALLVTLSCGYGFLTSQTTSDFNTALLTLVYTTFAIAIYIYTYDTTSNSLKRLGVILTILFNVAGLYIAWTVWAIIRSDYQLYLFSEPVLLWKNLISMASDTNVKLVHSRYPDMNNPSTILYCYWVLEFVCMVMAPALFALQAITGYSDQKISAEELHHRFDSQAIKESID